MLATEAVEFGGRSVSLVVFITLSLVLNISWFLLLVEKDLGFHFVLLADAVHSATDAAAQDWLFLTLVWTASCVKSLPGLMQVGGAGERRVDCARASPQAACVGCSNSVCLASGRPLELVLLLVQRVEFPLDAVQHRFLLSASVGWVQSTGRFRVRLWIQSQAHRASHLLLVRSALCLLDNLYIDIIDQLLRQKVAVPRQVLHVDRLELVIVG